MLKKRLSLTLLLGATSMGLGLWAQSALAADPFAVAVTVNNTGVSGARPGVFIYSQSYSDLTQAFNSINNTQLSSISSSYTSNSAVYGQINYLGVPVYGNFSANSNTLNFSIPAIGLNQTFVGTDRDDAVNQLVKFLKGNNGTLINQFQNYLAGHSEVSPVAGNPSSLQGTMVANTFSSTGLNTIGNTNKTTESGVKFGLGVSSGQFSSQHYSGTNLNYGIESRYLLPNPRWQLITAGSGGYQNISSASTYSAQLALGLQIPVKPDVDWYVTPMAAVGGTGSLNLGAAGVLTSFSVTSRYTYHANPNLDITLGNMVGVVQSQGIKVGSLNIDPKISNTVLKNGVLVEYNTGKDLWGSTVTVRGGVAETNLFGTKLYMNNYTELFADVGLNDDGNLPFYKRMRPGFTLTLGKGFAGINFGLGYTF